MAYQQILFDRSEGVGMVTLNRPDQLNAFTPLMLDELLDVFKGMERDSEVRAIVVTGAGKAFCAGEDFKNRAINEVGPQNVTNGPTPVNGPAPNSNYNPASSVSSAGGTYTPVSAGAYNPYQPTSSFSPLNPGSAPLEVSNSSYNPDFTSNTPVNPQPVSNLPSLTEQVQRAYNPLIRQILHIEKPVIAAINGTAAGFGLGLALACDLRYASDRARFLEVATRVGLLPGGGNGYFLPRLLGISRALELAFSSDQITATEAEKLGLISKVFPAEQLATEVRNFAVHLAKGPTRALGLTKTLMYSSLNLNLAQSLELETQLLDEVARTEDYKEGLTAYLQNRPPEYKGR